MQQVTNIIFTGPTELHARPAAILVQTAGRYKAQICLYLDGSEKFANARSIVQVLELGVRQGDRLKIVADGDDALEALKAISNALLGKAS